MKLDNLQFPSGKTVAYLKKQSKKTRFLGTVKSLDKLSKENGLNMSWAKSINHLKKYWSKYFLVFSYRINDHYIVDVRVRSHSRKEKAKMELLKASKTLSYEAGELYLEDDYDGSVVKIDDAHARLWSSNGDDEKRRLFGFENIKLPVSRWGEIVDDIESSKFKFYDKDVESLQVENARWAPIVSLKKRLSKKIFDKKFPNGESLIKYIHISMVQPDQMIVHYFTNTAVIERNEPNFLETEIDKVICEDQELSNLNLSVSTQYEEALSRDWEHPWSETRFSGFPTFVGKLCSLTGQVYGAVFFDAHTGKYSERDIANSYIEKEDVPFGPEAEGFLSKHEIWHGLVFSKGLNEESIDAVLKKMPLNSAGQCKVLIYKDYEWEDGLYTDGKSGFEMTSISDRIPVNVSKEKRKLRGEFERRYFDGALFEKSLKGIENSLSLSVNYPSGDFATGYYENSTPVKELCEFWNSKSGMENEAGAFRIYWWNKDAGVFQAADPEEPNWEDNYFEHYKDSMMVFDCKDIDLFFVVIFTEKSQEWTCSGGLTEVKTVGGTTMYEVGVEKDNYDEAFFSMVGLKRLHSFIGEI